MSTINEDAKENKKIIHDLEKDGQKSKQDLDGVEFYAFTNKDGDVNLSSCDDDGKYTNKKIM